MKLHFNSFVIKLLLTVMITVASLYTTIAQQYDGVGIGTKTPDKSALLDLSSSNKGLLLPRMTFQQRNAINQPAQGLIIYQTDLLNGAYIYNGADWSPLTISLANATTGATTWNTLGNVGLDAGSFLGTTDDVPLTLKVNNEFAGILDGKRSNTFLGYKTGFATQSFNSVVLGAYALQRASTGNDNVVIGYQSMFSHEDGQYNVAIGSLSLASNALGNKNTILGAMAGYRSKGSSNIFIGFQAGYFEQGSEKLYINNNASSIPLIYGDFKTKFVGINTSTPTNTLSINSGKDGNSGLQLQSLTSASALKESNQKVLTVDEAGNVILVPDLGQGGTTSTENAFWAGESSNSIVNKNAGTVKISNNLNVKETIIGKRVEVSDGGVVFKSMNALSTPLAANGKVLTLDNFGNVILVNDAVGETKTESEWVKNGADLTNSNNGKVVIKNTLEVSESVAAKGFTIGVGGLKFSSLSSKSQTSSSNGKALSVDTNGNVILVNDAVGQMDPTFWKSSNGRVELKQTAKVVIGEGITNFPDAFNLFVSKGILAERVRVAVPNSDKWADYVFRPNYRLMPLGEVGKFIGVNHHLPNMISAQEAADKGMDVLEMSVKLLEKVEELTLYAIEADKRIERLEKRLSELEK